MADNASHPVLATLLDGGTDDRERAELERHLLACDACWEAVRDDRRGRLAAEDLRETAPAALRDRVVLVTEACGPSRGRSRRPRRRIAPVAMCAGAALAAVGALSLGQQGGSQARSGEKPTIVSVVTRLASSPTAHPVPALLNETKQQASMSTTRSYGSSVVVARSPTPFAMPAGAVPMTSATSPWVARRGRVTLVCFNVPHPILVASVIPPDRLIPLARQLGAHRP